ncbi:MAG: hypothetical protein ACF8NJ_00895 [Phycisphaerales bacterium JB038]
MQYLKNARRHSLTNHARSGCQRRGRALRLVALLLVVAVASVLILLAVISSTSNTRVENWLGQRFAELANFYLVPELAYESLDYQAPYSVTIEGARLVAEGGFTLAEIGRLELTLAERPRRGTPIRISRLRFLDPSINLQRTEAGFRGLDPIVQDRGQRDEQIAAGTAPKTLLSDILRLEHLTIVNGALQFDQGDGAPPMIWNQINFAMADERVREEGTVWHDVSANLDRLPVSSLDVQARVNLDEQRAEIERATFAVNLSEEGVQVLPPQVQQLLARHQARGSLTLDLAGELRLEDWEGSELEVEMNASDALVVAGDYQLPLEAMRAAVRLGERRLEMDSFYAQALRGEIEASCALDLAEPNLPVQLQWEVKDLHLRDTIAAVTEAEAPARTPMGPPAPAEATGVEEEAGAGGEEAKPAAPVKYAGLVTGSGHAAYAIRTGPTSLAGAGVLQVREGRLVNIPILADIADVVTGNKEGEAFVFKDRADIEFTLTSEAVKVESYKVVSTLAAARGKGRIFYDGRLALTANAGPLEKAQEALGVVGDLFASLTDRLVTYDIGGTVSEPTVTVRPLGIGTNPETE